MSQKRSLSEKETALSRRKVGIPQEWRKVDVRGRVVGRKGKHLLKAAVNLGQSTKMCQTVVCRNGDTSVEARGKCSS